jgi:hypothetical protein
MTDPSRNGMRQPHALYVSLSSTPSSTNTMPAIVALAHGDIHMMSPLARPRRPGSDHSMASGTAEVYSPPRKIPPSRRRTRIVQSVPLPSTAWLGTRAISSIVNAMPARATFVVTVRPIRSETGPKTAAPIGRPRRVATKISPALLTRFSGPNRCAAAGARAITGRKMSNWST